MTRGVPRNFETAEQMARAMAQLALYELPEDYYDTFIAEVSAVSVERARQAAVAHLDPDRLAVAIVADASIVTPQLSAAGLGDPVLMLPRL